jgi:hypothetical protein
MPATGMGNIEKTFTVHPPSNVSHQYGIINGQPRLFSSRSQKLYVSIPASLINYYGNLTHTINDNSDYAQLVTPKAVEPIADNILKVTEKLPNPDEQFADAVLALVHQIPYNVTNPQYPVETLADNMGDCVDLSLLAASIMEAGGLNVVLILYTNINPQHMNVGVYLPYTPVYHTPLMTPTSFTYDNKTYWTAEATPEGNWKVGDQSSALSTAKANIIPLSGASQSLSFGQVAASLNTNLVPSTITIIPSERSINNDVGGVRSLNISGAITPAIPDQPVNVYISSNTGDNPEVNFLTATTDNDGEYNLTWNFTASGTYYITASWSGASNYAGADSQTIPVFIGPQSYFQFSTIDYNYIFGIPGLAAFATTPMQGANGFLTLPLGTNVSLSYEFIVMQAGQIISNVPTANVSVSAFTEKVMLPNGKIKTVQIPAYNQTVPVNVPNGLEPLRLPDDFNQTIDNQFSFILQNNEGNYSLNFKGLSQEDLSDMQAHASIANETENVKQNTWYQVTASVDGNGSTTRLSYLNGTLIASVGSQNSGNQTVLLIGNNEDTAIALKNVTIQTQNQGTQQPSGTQKPTVNTANPNFTLYAAAAALAATATATVVYVRTKKSRQTKK